ncbi:hypothetical protein GQR58_026484 [Nymphon striatum]|nr:hypothetical protein GQR58_026484 [Nymphon striatum]
MFPSYSGLSAISRSGLDAVLMVSVKDEVDITVGQTCLIDITGHPPDSDYECPRLPESKEKKNFIRQNRVHQNIGKRVKSVNSFSVDSYLILYYSIMLINIRESKLSSFDMCFYHENMGVFPFFSEFEWILRYFKTWSYFSLHDYDKDGKLDGLELLKSMIHEHGDHSTNTKQQVQERIRSAEGVVDAMIKEKDFDEDGLLSFAEFKYASHSRR